MGKYFCGVCKLFDDDVSKRKVSCIFFVFDVEVCLAEIFVCDFRSRNSSTTAMDVGYAGAYLLLCRSWHSMDTVNVNYGS
jgi:hypothetical protein